jgi:hypothetical protein
VGQYWLCFCAGKFILRLTAVADRVGVKDCAMGRSNNANSIRKYEERLTQHWRARLAWSAFPRCAAPVLAAFALALTLAPWEAVATWAIAWLVLSLPVRRMPGLYNRGLWRWFAPPVFAVYAWPVRWLLIADGVAVALLHGALLTLSLAAAAGWIIVDAWYTFDRS